MHDDLTRGFLLDILISNGQVAQMYRRCGASMAGFHQASNGKRRRQR